MSRNRKYRVLKDTLKKNIRPALLLLFSFLICLTVFLLYNIILEPLFYSFALCFTLFLLSNVFSFLKELRRARSREVFFTATDFDADMLLKPSDLTEEDYRTLLRRIKNESEKNYLKLSEEYADMVDYYTVWAHGIKTPISVLKLKLSDDISSQAELLRIEQYVDTVLQYIRLGSSTTDLVIREYPLDDIIREEIRKFASLFVLKKLSLHYEETKENIVTDRKWFSCILDQIIGNAVKYTGEGSITIRVFGKTVSVKDTGIGIAAEDLPRIFEKGYTGNNGRNGHNSSGFGLYIAKKSADLLSLDISVKSRAGAGSEFIIFPKL